MSLVRRIILSLPLLFLMALASAAVAQLSFTPATYDFGEVMVDSTRTTTVALTSQIVQDVTLTSDSPHFTVEPGVVSFTTVGESHDVTIHYHPVGIGQHTGSVTANGAIWGTAPLAVSGRGVLVSLATSPDSLLFGNVPVSQTVTLDVTVSNTGTGTLVITDIVSSDPQFSAAVDTLIVPEGGSDVLPVTFTPVHTGLQTATVSFTTNAPYTPYVAIQVLGAGTSEISGTVSGTWTVENSPYQVVGPISVPAGESLTIEPGVEVVFNGSYTIMVEGALRAAGTEEAPVTLTSVQGLGALQSSGTAASIELSHCLIDSIGNNQSYLDSFESGQLVGLWHGDGTISTVNPYSGQYCMELYALDQDAEAILGPFTYNGSMTIDYYWRSDLSESNCYYRLYYRRNGGGWSQLYSYYYTTGWSHQTHYISANTGDIIEFRFLADVYSTSSSYDEERVYLDNVTVNFNGVQRALDLDGGRLVLDHTVIKGASGDAIHAVGLDSITILDSEIDHATAQGLWANGSPVVRIERTRIHDCGNDPIDVTTTGAVTLSGCIVDNNSGTLRLDNTSGIDLTYCLVHDNTGGVYLDGPSFIDHCTIIDNGSYGLTLEAGDFYTLYNSILWNNTGSSYYYQISNGGYLDVYYTAVQRGTSGIAGSGYSVTHGLVNLDPLFTDDAGHLGQHSPCIDAAAPWEHDAYMPPGLGTIVADMGVYGGPGNTIWDGTPVPDGKPVIEHIVDIPQDQGGQVGIQYAASIFDGQHPAYDVTRYSFWRAMDLKSGEPPEAADHPTDKIFTTGKGQYWEYVGEMVAQQFPSYAFTAPTYADSCSAGTFDIEFLVIAHTPDDDIFFTSDPVAGHSVDNLAPPAPAFLAAEATLDGIYLHWPPSLAGDVSAYHVFRSLTPDMDITTLEPVATVADTAFLDETVDAQQPYFYVVVAEDSHDNRSGPSIYAYALAPVPTELQAATIDLVGDLPVVSWQLATDVSLSFRIERAAASGPFLPVDGTIETTTEGGFRFVDPTAVGGQAYRYRVLARQDDREWVLFTSEPVTVPPLTFTLGPARPNPFNPATTLSFTTTRPGHVTLSVHDLMGRCLALLVDEVLPAGHHQVTWRGVDGDGRSLGSGIYFARLVSAEGTRKVKLLLNR